MPAARSNRLLLTALLWGFPALAISEGDSIDRIRERFRSVTPLTFDSGGPVGRQFHLEAASYLEMATVARTVPTRPLPSAPRADLARLPIRHGDTTSTFGTYVDTSPWVDGVIVLHGGRIVLERYPHMAPWQRFFSWSVSKVITSVTLARLVTEGRVDPGRDVTDYVPELGSSVWDATSVRDVANMASGIDCRDSDGYQTPTTCIYRLEEALGITAPTGYEAGLVAHLRAMQRRGPPGAVNEYASANTIVLALVIEAVTGRPFARAVQDLVWTPMGPEADGLVAVSDEGYAYASAGFTLRLRDLARFGEVIVRPEDFGVIDDAMLRDMQGPRGIDLEPSTRARLASAFPGDAPVRASWQWDLVWEDGAMFKGGYSGQGLYVDPARDLVVAWFGTGEDFGARRNALRSIARQIATSGLFETEASTP